MRIGMFKQDSTCNDRRECELRIVTFNSDCFVWIGLNSHIVASRVQSILCNSKIGFYNFTK